MKAGAVPAVDAGLEGCLQDRKGLFIWGWCPRRGETFGDPMSTYVRVMAGRSSSPRYMINGFNRT